MRRLIFPVLLGLVGCAVLLWLGFWQVDRLGQKEAMIAAIDARIGDAPVPLPAQPTEAADEYLAVTVSGTLTGEELHVLKGVTGQSPAYRVIAVLETDQDRRILTDLGTVPASQRGAERRGAVTITGNLHWPNEAGRWTPAPDDDGTLWYARDVAPMARALAAEPVLVVARAFSGAELQTTPVPVDTASIPNDHLGYSITWFGLALVWALMSLVLIRRTLRAAP